MNSAEYVDQYIQKLKNSGMPLPDQAWKLADACVGWPYIFGDRGQECTPSKRKAVYKSHPDQEGLVSKCQVLSGSKGNCTGCKWYPGGKRVRSYDCRGFTYWILKQIYGWELYGAGATSQWNTANNWKAKGTIDTVPEDMLVCLFYTDKKNVKVMAHTGLGYHGETYECSNGVQFFKSRNKKWTHWAVPACVEGDVPVPDPDKKPTLKKGSSGPFVTLAQTELIQKGYDCGKWGADGKFGSATEEAVKQFQTSVGLEATGIVDEATWEKLDEPVFSLYTVTIPHLTFYKAQALVAQYSGSSMAEERG